MKKEVRKISTLTLFNLDPEVVFHTIDVTLNSSIDIVIMSDAARTEFEDLRKQPTLVCCDPFS
jgi:hypothetical protein